MNSSRVTKSTSDAPEGWNPLTLAVLASAWIATLPNWPLWRALLALETASSFTSSFVAMLSSVDWIWANASGAPE